MSEQLKMANVLLRKSEAEKIERIEQLESLVREMWREIMTCPDYKMPPCMTRSICEQLRNFEIGGGRMSGFWTCHECGAEMYGFENCQFCGAHKGGGRMNNYEKLFGTPERAANVILALQICPCVKDECVFCPAHDVCFEHYKDGRTVYEMAEWLRGDAE